MLLNPNKTVAEGLSLPFYESAESAQPWLDLHFILLHHETYLVAVRLQLGPFELVSKQDE